MIAFAGAESAARLAALHAAAFDAPWSEAEFAKLLANPAAFALLAADAEPHGFVLAWAIAGEAEILTLAVTPHARRRGIGAALMVSAMEAAMARGAESMLLEVAADNDAAQMLYARLGFVEVGRRANYYQRGERAVDALVLRRALALPGHDSPEGGNPAR